MASFGFNLFLKKERRSKQPQESRMAGSASTAAELPQQ